MKNNYSKTRRAVFNLTVHMVFVTKYRLCVFDVDMLHRLEEVFNSVCKSWDSELLEFNGEQDHVHLLVSYPPQKLLSSLIANLKATSSKTMWREFENIMKSKFWSKKVLWTGSYFVASCGGVTIEQLKKYVQNQERPDSSQR